MHIGKNWVTLSYRESVFLKLFTYEKEAVRKLDLRNEDPDLHPIRLQEVM